MIRKCLSTVLIVTTLGLSSVAMAQPGQPDQGPQNGQPTKMQQQPGNGENGHRAPPGHAQRSSRPSQNGPQQALKGPQPHQDWHQGGKMPQDYRDDRYAVSDWRAHQLPEPAHGQRWMEINGDYVLVAVATGVIASIMIGHH